MNINDENSSKLETHTRNKSPAWYHNSQAYAVAGAGGMVWSIFFDIGCLYKVPQMVGNPMKVCAVKEEDSLSSAITLYLRLCLHAQDLSSLRDDHSGPLRCPPLCSWTVVNHVS